MDRIRHELTGYTIPAYVEEILTRNYCSGFLRMSIVKNHSEYLFSYRPENYKRLDSKKLSLYEKIILIRTLVAISEKNRDHLINPETYLIEPELIYLRDNNVTDRDVRIMYYPDVKSLSFRYKLVLFTDRLMDRKIKEERDFTEQLRIASEPGDINRIKLMLDKHIIRLENRMSDGRILA